LGDVLAGLPCPAFVVVTTPVAKALVPAVLPTTLTLYVHVVFAGNIPVVNATDVAPAVGENVPAQPAGLADADGVAATVTPLGKEELNATPFMMFALGFCRVIVNCAVAPTAIVDGATLMPTVGPATTLSVVAAAVPLGVLGVVEVMIPVL
jgi:hypothetical protein